MPERRDAAGGIEVVERRARDAKHFDLGDDNFRATFARRLHYDDNGTWRDVDTEIRQESVEATDFPVAIERSGITVGRRSGTPLTYLTADAKATNDGEKATVVYDSIAWTFTPTRFGLKAAALVSAPLGKRTFRFPIATSAALRVEPAHPLGGGQIVSDDFVIPRVVVFRNDTQGSLGGKRIDKAGPWRVGRGFIEFDYDDSHLPPEAFPYVLDPSSDFDIAAGADDAYVFKYGGSWGSLSNGPVLDTTDAGGILAVKDKSNHYGVNPALAVILLRWDTSSLPDTATVTAADLESYITQGNNSDSRNWTGEWYAGDGSWGTDDYTETVSTSAFSVAISSLSLGADTRSLTDPDSNISKTGNTGLRLHISGGEPSSSGWNEVSIQPYENAGTAEARLAVTYTTSVDDTATPATVVTTAAVPAVTVTAEQYATATPAAIATTTAVPAVTIDAESNATVTPAAIATTAALPAASVQVDDTVTPSTITATVAIPAVTVDTAANATVTPDEVATTVAVPAPTVTTEANATVTPATITATVAAPAVTVVAEQYATVTPATIAATVACPAASVRGDDTVEPDTITASVALPAAATTTDWTATPDAIVATVAVPAPTILAAGNATVSPATIAATVAVPAPTVTAESNATVTPDSVAATATCPAATTSTESNATVTPAAIAVTVACPTTTITATSTVELATIEVVVAAPTADVVAQTDATATPAAITCTVTMTVTLDVIYSFFAPPLTEETPTTRATDTPWDRHVNDLATKYEKVPRARNVFILKDGSVVDEMPAAVYADGVLTTTGPDRVRRTFHGGHEPQPIDESEYALLDAAGWV